MFLKLSYMVVNQMIEFIAGLLIGGIFGAMTISILVSAGNADKKI